MGCVLKELMFYSELVQFVDLNAENFPSWLRYFELSPILYVTFVCLNGPQEMCQYFLRCVKQVCAEFVLRPPSRVVTRWSYIVSPCWSDPKVTKATLSCLTLEHLKRSEK